MAVPGMSACNHVHGLRVHAVLGKAGCLSHEMDRLPLPERSRALPGQVNLSLDHKDHLLMTAARLEFPPLLACFEHSIDQVAGVAACLVKAKYVLS